MWPDRVSNLGPLTYESGALPTALRGLATSMVMSGQSVNLPTLFLGRLRPPKRLTSTLCTYFRQKLTTALLESAEGETKVCGRTGYRTRDLWLLKQTRGEGTYTN